MKINIIGSGSSGNSILFDDSVLLDAGLSYKKFDGLNIDIVLLSHCHSDHINNSTIRKLYIANNDLKFCCGSFLKKNLLDIGLPEKNIVVVEAGKLYRKGDITFSPVNLYHDVPNIGYRLFKGNYKHFAATDTDHLKGISAKDYYSATIECNHDLDTALAIIEKAKETGNFTHMERTINTHLNVDQAIKFVKDNNIKKLIPVHMGSSTKNQVIKTLNSNGVIYEQ